MTEHSETTTATQEEQWFAFRAYGQETRYGYGLHEDADAFADTLNEGREINLYAVYPLTQGQVSDLRSNGHTLDDIGDLADAVAAEDDDDAPEFDAERYADHMIDAWLDPGNVRGGDFEPTVEDALAYFDATVPLDMAQREPLRYRPSAHSYDTVVIAAPETDAEVAQARAHFAELANFDIARHAGEAA